MPDNITVYLVYWKGDPHPEIIFTDEDAARDWVAIQPNPSAFKIEDRCAWGSIEALNKANGE